MIRFHRFVALLAAALLTAPSPPASAWQTAHGDPDNSGAADVRTAPAVTPLAVIAGLGDIAPGAGPVIAADGTLYIGNMQGTLMSFRPDGTPGWRRDIGGFQSILASPAIGNDGSIYVVGSAHVRDNTTSPATQKRVTELHKFTAGGGWVWHSPFPADAAGVTVASPNILQADGKDIVIVPSGGTYAAHLTAISGDSGAILIHQRVTNRPPSASGGVTYQDVLCAFVQIGGVCGFNGSASGPPAQNRLPHGLKIPFPAAAIFTPPANAPALIFVSDGFQDLAMFSFGGTLFREHFRVLDDKRYLASPPLAWPEGHVMIATGGFGTKPEVMYARHGFSTIRAAAPFSLAAPPPLATAAMRWWSKTAA